MSLDTGLLAYERLQNSIPQDQQLRAGVSQHCGLAPGPQLHPSLSGSLTGCLLVSMVGLSVIISKVARPPPETKVCS